MENQDFTNESNNGTTFVPAKCPSCGGVLTVDPTQEAAVCQFCNTPFIVSKAVNNYNVSYNTYQTTVVNQAKKGTVESILDYASQRKQQQLEEERLRAEEERRRAEEERRRAEEERIRQEERSKKKKTTVLWVLGWIFIFPVPLTIILARQKKMNPKLKYGLIAAVWIVYIIFALASRGADIQETPSNYPEHTTSAVVTQQVTKEPQTETTKPSEDQIPVPGASSSFIGMDYEQVVKKFTEAGFTNITTKAQYDIVWGITKEKSTASVSIDGNKSFRKDETFGKNSPIVITYHMKEGDDPEKQTEAKTQEVTQPPVIPEGKIKIGKGAHDYTSVDKTDAEKYLRDLGFTNITFSPVGDLILGWLTKDGEVDSVSINGKTNYKEDDYFSPDAKIVISYHTFEGNICTNGLEHTWVTDKGKPATCTTTGLTDGEHCSVCGKVNIEQKTLTAEHTWVTDKGKPATCTTTGLSDGEHCSVCGKVNKEQKILPATHTVVVDKAVAATETQTGLSEGSHCSVCGTVLKEQSVTYWSITVENNPEFAALFSTKKPYTYAEAADFAKKHSGERIEFDCSLDYLAYSSSSSTTIFDFLFTYGDYSDVTSVGPVFKADKTSVFSYKCTDGITTLAEKDNLHIVARVVSFNSNTGLFFIELERVSHRSNNKQATTAPETTKIVTGQDGSGYSAIAITGSNYVELCAVAQYQFNMDTNYAQITKMTDDGLYAVTLNNPSYYYKLCYIKESKELLWVELKILGTKDPYGFFNEMSAITSDKYDFSKASSWIRNNVGTNNTTVIDGIKYVYTTQNGVCTLQFATNMFFILAG